MNESAEPKKLYGIVRLVNTAVNDGTEIAEYIEKERLSLNDVSVYDVLTDKGTALGMQMSLHTKSSLLSIRDKSYMIFEGRNK